MAGSGGAAADVGAAGGAARGAVLAVCASGEALRDYAMAEGMASGFAVATVFVAVVFLVCC